LSRLAGQDDGWSNRYSATLRPPLGPINMVETALLPAVFRLDTHWLRHMCRPVVVRGIVFWDSCNKSHAVSVCISEENA